MDSRLYLLATRLILVVVGDVLLWDLLFLELVEICCGLGDNVVVLADLPVWSSLGIIIFIC